MNTDIHAFTISYLGGTPWDLPDVYAKTSPITYIKDAATPTQIQHDSGDPRVPPPNALELYQGPQDVGVPTNLVLYDADSHGIPTPKQRLPRPGTTGPRPRSGSGRGGGTAVPGRRLRHPYDHRAFRQGGPRPCIDA